MHWSPDRLLFAADLQTDESEGCSGPVDVIVPLVVVFIESPGELSGFWLGELLDRALDPLRTTIFLFKSSRSKDLRGDTFIIELKLLDVAVCICTLPDGDVLRLTGPFRCALVSKFSSTVTSCLIGMRDIDGVMLVSFSRRMGGMWLLDGALEFESADWGELGHSPFNRWEDSLDWGCRGWSH